MIHCKPLVKWSGPRAQARAGQNPPRDFSELSVPKSQNKTKPRAGVLTMAQGFRARRQWSSMKGRRSTHEFPASTSISILLVCFHTVLIHHWLALASQKQRVPEAPRGRRRHLVECCHVCTLECCLSSLLRRRIQYLHATTLRVAQDWMSKVLCVARKSPSFVSFNPFVQKDAT